jgi:hypothetical protein
MMGSYITLRILPHSIISHGTAGDSSGEQICDGVYGPMQNKIKQEFTGLSAHNNMLSMNLIQGIFSLVQVGMADGVPSVSIRGFSDVMAFCQRNPAIVPMIGYMVLTMIAGNLFIYEVGGVTCL